MASTSHLRLRDVSSAEGEVISRVVDRARQEFSVVDVERKVNSLIVSPKLMVYAAIVRPSRAFRLRGTFVIDSQHLDDGTIFVRHRDLPVYGYGETFADAIDSFGEMFERQWVALVEDKDAELTESAEAVAEQLRLLVESIIPR